MTGDIDDFRHLLAKVAGGGALTADEAERAFDIMMTGNATPAQMGGFLIALRVRGETIEEITGAARAMRAKVLKVDAPAGTIDIVGTGGDAHGTYNISTCASLVVAGAGVRVAKHGNRAFTSKSGAADVLTALGVNTEVSVAALERAVREVGICFLMAPRHHSAMRNVAGPRVELAPTRTVFNILGPLSNPALVTRQLVGVFDRRWVVPVARVLGNLGLERALVVHGSDGMDEITTTGITYAAELRDGQVRELEIEPEAVGLPRASLDELRGADPAHNATALRTVLNGEPGAYRDIVVLNSAAALMVAGKAADLKEGAAIAGEAIDSGKARRVLDRLIALSNEREAS